MRSIVLIISIVVFVFPVRAANPVVNKAYKYYDLVGGSTNELIYKMNKDGPKGFWAYTEWYVNWSSNCRVKVAITITLPKWKNKNKAPVGLQKKWISMLAKLKQHEENHGKHGVGAAKELISKKCRKGDKILKKWIKKDKVYDQKTQHGKLEGVGF